MHQKAVRDVAYQHISSSVYDEMILKHRPFMGLQGTSHMVAGLWNQHIQGQKKLEMCKKVVAK